MTIHKYRVRDGFTYGPFGEHKAGDIVELDDSTAVHEMDKLELAEVIPPPPSAPVVEETPLLPPTPTFTTDQALEQTAPPKKHTTRKKSTGD